MKPDFYKESYIECDASSFNVDVRFALKIPELEIFYEILRKEKNSLARISSRTRKFEFYENFVDMMIRYFDECLNFEEKSNIAFGTEEESSKNIYESFLCSCYNMIDTLRKHQLYCRILDTCKFLQFRNSTLSKNFFFGPEENFFGQREKTSRKFSIFSSKTFVSSFVETVEILSLILTYWYFYEKKDFFEFSSKKRICARKFRRKAEGLFNEILRRYSKIEHDLNFSRKAFRKLFLVVHSSCFEIFSKRMNWKKFVENFSKFVEDSKKFSFLPEGSVVEFGNCSSFAENSNLAIVRTLGRWSSKVDFHSFFFLLSRFFLENFLFGHMREVLSYMTKTGILFRMEFSTTWKRRYFSNFFDRSRKIVKFSRFLMEKSGKKRNRFERFFLNCMELKISMHMNNFHDLENFEKAFEKRKNMVEEFVRNFLRKFPIYDERSVRSRRFLLPYDFRKNHFSGSFRFLRIRPTVGKELFAKKYRYRVNIPKSSKMNLDMVKNLLLKSNFEIVENSNSRTLFFNSENEDDMVNMFLLSFDRKKFSGTLTIHKKILFFEVEEKLAKMREKIS